MRNPSPSASTTIAITTTTTAAAVATTGTRRTPPTTKTTGTGTPCCSKVGLKRGPWTPEEDALLANYIKKEGEGRWRTLPKRAGLLRCGKSCRLRWMNYLRPSVKRGQIAPDEEDLILRLHRLLGNRWSLIAGRIPGRTDNEIKNYWNTHLSKKLISQGIDPRTHKPLNPESVDHPPLKASSSKAAATRKSSPAGLPNNNNNPAAVSSAFSAPPETATGATTPFISSKETGYLQNHNGSLGQSHQPTGTNISATLSDYTSLLSCGGPGMDLRSNVIQGPNNEEDREEDINCCTDDVFSSFLNSLINEEALITSQQHQLLQLPNAGLDTLNSSLNPSTISLATGWESALISSTFNQNDSQEGP